MTRSTAYYPTPPTGLRDLGLTVSGVGLILDQDTWRADRTLPCHAGILVTAGSGQLTRQDRAGRFPVRAGTFFWLPAGVTHGYGPDPGGWSEYWVLFDGPAAGCYSGLGYLGGGPPALEPERPGEVRELLLRLLRLGGQPESLSHHVAAAGTMHALISAVGTRGAADDPAEPGRLAIGRRALELLTRAVEEPVSIGAVARRLGVSRDTLSVAVRELTGSTPSDYLTRRRLDRAKALLAETDRPVAAVARSVGYPDPAYFTRVFTRKTGVPPSVFRQQQKS
ncbi:AraC family transcriptional regulator [Streptomyces boninensis]|uniref:AraC family transcriptional regulator n=1 Tax=Streptomyces boninensis TaxID=2039455 RepID=UPI003B20BB2E